MLYSLAFILDFLLRIDILMCLIFFDLLYYILILVYKNIDLFVTLYKCYHLRVWFFVNTIIVIIIKYYFIFYTSTHFSCTYFF